MRTITLAACLLSMAVSSTVLSNENEDIQDELAMLEKNNYALLNTCKSWAAEDDISPTDLDEYLIQCVYDELNASSEEVEETSDEELEEPLLQ